MVTGVYAVLGNKCGMGIEETREYGIERMDKVVERIAITHE